LLSLERTALTDDVENINPFTDKYILAKWQWWLEAKVWDFQYVAVKRLIAQIHLIMYVQFKELD